jgi:short-subunit dehydrogenase
MASHNTASGKTALVTGASGGIGKAIAHQFAKDGVNLVIAARSTTVLNQLASDWIKTHGVQVSVIAADLSESGAAQALYEEVEQRGIAIDYLVNNAGYGLYGLFEDTRLEDELAMMRINMETLTILTNRFLPGILARKGRIMNVASTAAFQPGPYMAVYYATKSYVLSFTEALASELAGSGVTVTALCPGPTRSGFQDKAAMNDSALVKGKRLPTADAVGRAGYNAMQRGQRVYIPGAMNWLMAQSVRFTPRILATTLVRKMSMPI